MKLLFDHNLSFKLVNRLSDLYPDSSHVYLVGLGKADDLEIYEHARQEGYTVVTKDADFSDLCLLLGYPPKVIWIRLGNCKTLDVENILRNHHNDVLALASDPTVGVLTLF